MKSSTLVAAFAVACTAANAASPTTDAARIQKIAGTVLEIPMGKEPPLRLSLAQVMKAYNVPGLSVAVIDNYQIV